LLLHNGPDFHWVNRPLRFDLLVVFCPSLNGSPETQRSYWQSRSHFLVGISALAEMIDRSVLDVTVRAFPCSNILHGDHFPSLQGESPENGSFLGFGWRLLGMFGPKSSNIGLQRLLAIRKARIWRAFLIERKKFSQTRTAWLATQC